MAKAWLILADTLVHLLLFVSLVLFYLYSFRSEPVNSFVLPLEQNLTLEDLTAMGEESIKEDFTEMDLVDISLSQEIFGEDFVDINLEEKLLLLKAKVGDPVFIRIFKEESLLEIWIRSGEAYQHVKNYRICAYSGVIGPKLREGDGQSPEGFYRVNKQKLNPKSTFHLSFDLGFPNKYDREHNRTGSYLMIHGNCVSIGCYAMTDEKIEEIYALVAGALEAGQKYVQVHAYPFRMTEVNMAWHSQSEWYDFWVNLKEGYDYFEAEKLPPNVKVKNAQYTIHESND